MSYDLFQLIVNFVSDVKTAELYPTYNYKLVKTVGISIIAKSSLSSSLQFCNDSQYVS